MSEDKLLTIEQAADFLSISQDGVRRYVNQGLIKAHKLGNHTNKRGNRRPWRIWQSDLIAFINRNEK